MARVKLSEKQWDALDGKRGFEAREPKVAYKFRSTDLPRSARIVG